MINLPQIIVFFFLFANLVFAQDLVSIDKGQSKSKQKVYLEIDKKISETKKILPNSPITVITTADSLLDVSYNLNYYSGKTNSLKLLSYAYEAMENYESSLSYLFRALELDLASGDPEAICFSYNSIGILYLKIGEYNSAKKYLLIALEICEKNENLKIAPQIYNSLASCYQETSEFDKAEENFKKALFLLEQRKDSTAISRVLNNLGFLKENSGNYKAATDYYQKALNIKRRLGKPIDIANTLQNLANTYISLSQVDKALPLLNESIVIAKSINHTRLLADGYRLLTYSYYFKRDAALSQKYSKLYDEANRTIDNIDRAQKISELKVKYESDTKKKENEYLISKNKLQSLYIVSLIIIFGVVLLLILNRYRIKRNANKQLTETASQLRNRIKFIEFLSSASSKLINLGRDKIADEITNTLRFISIYTHNKCSFVYSLNSNLTEFNLLHQSAEELTESEKIYKISTAELGEYFNVLLEEKPIYANSTSFDKLKFFQPFLNVPHYKTIKAFVLIPIKIENSLWGIIGYGTEEIVNELNEETISIYKVTGQIIANANFRKDSEEKLVVYSKELEEINKSKDRFYSMISHDLKSPFQGLLGFASFILNEIDSLSQDEIKEFVSNIETSAKNLFNLIENTLNWTRFEMGRIQFNPEMIDLYSLQEEVFSLLKGFAFKKNIEIVSEIPENFVIKADKKMITSIFSNLITNGIKFTGNGGKVIISVSKSSKAVTISFEDNGVGMSKDKIESLFNITTTQSSLGTNNEKGTGLGLILCKEMVEMHKGTIDISSKLNSGTKFTINIPQ